MMSGVSNSLHGLANMGVNATSNLQLLKILFDLIEINQNVLSKMNDQNIVNTIHSYVYHNYKTKNIILFL